MRNIVSVDTSRAEIGSLSARHGRVRHPRHFTKPHKDDIPTKYIQGGYSKSMLSSNCLHSKAC